MKEKYEDIKSELIVFETNDVIITSSVNNNTPNNTGYMGIID